MDYVAPEQVHGGVIDARTDIYALGAVLYTALSARVPYPRDDTAAKLFAAVNEPVPALHPGRPDVPAGLDDVVARATAKDPLRRYATAGELATAALLAVTGGSPAKKVIPPVWGGTGTAPMGHGATVPLPSRPAGGVGGGGGRFGRGRRSLLSPPSALSLPARPGLRRSVTRGTIPPASPAATPARVVNRRRPSQHRMGVRGPGVPTGSSPWTT